MAKKKLHHHEINRAWCKGCGLCVGLCPKGVLELDRDDKAVAAHPDKCIVCKLCEKICPDLAMTVVTEDDTQQEG